jgi:hypothetical protein
VMKAISQRMFGTRQLRQGLVWVRPRSVVETRARGE